MLKELCIENLALIDSAHLFFKPGLNVISGETGAGKSIILQAISLLLGGKSSSDLIQSGFESARVQGVFDLIKLEKMQERCVQSGFEVDGGEVLIQRTLFRNGRNRILVNGEFMTLQALLKLTEGWVDLCGQHEHQSLLKSSVQFNLLDQYAGSSGLAQLFKKNWTDYTLLLKEWSELGVQIPENDKQQKLIQFQIREIQRLEIEPQEEIRLQQEKELWTQAATKVSVLGALQEILDNEREGILDLLRLWLQKVKHSELGFSWLEKVEKVQEMLKFLESLSLDLNRESQLLQGMLQGENKLDFLLERLSELSHLKKRYGVSSLDEIFGFLNQLEEKLTFFEKEKHRFQFLSHQKERLEIDLRDQSKKLSEIRKKGVSSLSQRITSELKDLKMTESEFYIELYSFEDFSEWSSQGADQIDFLISTNLGGLRKPIAKIASGGELSRLILAIRNVLSGESGTGVYLFDEIDAGMGGQTAFVVGKKLKAVSASHQVICITHLPQVACFADQHYCVEKAFQASSNCTLTQVIELDEKTRLEELSRMLAGPILSQKSLDNAIELRSLALQE